MAVSVTKRYAYWSQPNAVSRLNFDGSQIISELGYWFWKVVYLEFASKTSIADSEITAAIESEFYPASGIKYQFDQGYSITQLEQIKPPLPIVSARLVGRYLAGTDIVYTGTDMSYGYWLPAVDKLEVVPFQLVIGVSDQQGIGYNRQLRRLVTWANAASLAKSDISNQLQLYFYHPVVNPTNAYIVSESSVIQSLNFVPRISTNLIQRYNCELVGSCWAKSKS